MKDKNKVIVSREVLEFCKDILDPNVKGKHGRAWQVRVDPTTLRMYDEVVAALKE